MNPKRKIAGSSPELRAGIGFDVHRLIEGRKLILGGVEIPHTRGLLGHSDADVLTHAVMSSLLGAMALGSLGDHFPDNDPAYKDISSIDLLERVRILMEENGYELGNVDVMVICDSPRLSPHIERIRMNLAGALRVPIEGISVKATSTEGLGFTGTGEGIAAQAICILVKCPDEEIAVEKKSPHSKKRTVAEKPAPLPKIEPGSIRRLVARIDGACNGNPGPSGIGIVFELEDGTVIGKASKAIGEKTNNQAEYCAALAAAKKASEWGVENLTLITDSELVKKQLKREYRVKNPEIIKLYERLYVILSKFKSWDVLQVSREKNREADRLSKLALKK